MAMRFSYDRLADFVQRRFDGNARKLVAMLELVDPSSGWNEPRVRRLLRGDTRFDQNDLAAFRVALSLDHIDDLYEAVN